MSENFKCEMTNIQFYECDVTKLNQTTVIDKGEKIILTANRYISKATTGFESSQDITFNGRKASIKYKLLLLPTDIFLIRVGTRVRFNFTTMFTQTPFNSNLKPFIYNTNLKDIIEGEIHELKMLHDCTNEYIAHVITYN